MCDQLGLTQNSSTPQLLVRFLVPEVYHTYSRCTGFESYMCGNIWRRREDAPRFSKSKKPWCNSCGLMNGIELGEWLPSDFGPTWYIMLQHPNGVFVTNLDPPKVGHEFRMVDVPSSPNLAPVTLSAENLKAFWEGKYGKYRMPPPQNAITPVQCGAPYGTQQPMELPIMQNTMAWQQMNLYTQNLTVVPPELMYQNMYPAEIPQSAQHLQAHGLTQSFPPVASGYQLPRSQAAPALTPRDETSRDSSPQAPQAPLAFRPLPPAAPSIIRPSPPAKQNMTAVPPAAPSIIRPSPPAKQNMTAVPPAAPSIITPPPAKQNVTAVPPAAPSIIRPSPPAKQNVTAVPPAAPSIIRPPPTPSRPATAVPPAAPSPAAPAPPISPKPTPPTTPSPAAPAPPVSHRPAPPAAPVSPRPAPPAAPVSPPAPPAAPTAPRPAKSVLKEPPPATHVRAAALERFDERTFRQQCGDVYQHVVYFEEGDIIELDRATATELGWILGRNTRTGASGYVPEAYMGSYESTS